MVRNFRKLILLLFILNSVHLSYAQQDSLFTVIIENVPENRIPKGYSQLLFSIDEVNYRLHLLAADFDKSKIIGTVVMDFPFNSEQMFESPYFNQDTIYLCSVQAYRVTEVCAMFYWNGKNFMYIKAVTTDENIEIIRKADSSINAGNIELAVYYLNGIQYPYSYIDPAEKSIALLNKAHETAQVHFKKNQYDSAVYIMKKAFEFWGLEQVWDYTAMDNMKEDGWTEEQVKLWLGDYGLFLLKAKEYDHSIEVNTWLSKVLPEFPEPYLQLGDACFEKNNPEEAKKYYLQYRKIMNAAKRKKEIPKRVKERT